MFCKLFIKQLLLIFFFFKKPLVQPIFYKLKIQLMEVQLNIKNPFLIYTVIYIYIYIHTIKHRCPNYLISLSTSKSAIYLISTITAKPFQLSQGKGSKYNIGYFELNPYVYLTLKTPPI